MPAFDARIRSAQRRIGARIAAAICLLAAAHGAQAAAEADPRGLQSSHPTGHGAVGPPPLAPTDLRVRPRNLALAASWQAPDDSGSSITRYEVRYQASYDGIWRNSGYRGIATSTIVSGLENDVLYQVRVRAWNAHGRGAWSAPASTTPEVQPPDAPAAPTVLSGNTRLTAFWNMPADNGSSIRGYDVQYQPGAAGSWIDYQRSIPGTSTVIAGLTNGGAYAVRVRARNRIGDGAWSPAAALNVGAPRAPAAPVLAVGNRRIDLTWEAPDAIAAAISRYEIDYRPDRDDAAWRRLFGTQTQATIGKLDNGSAYAVRVRAGNRFGNGLWSPVATATLPYRPPDAPAAPTLAGGDARLLVGWQAPPDNGSFIFAYGIRYRPGAGAWRDHRHLGSATSTAIAGLVNGTLYEVQVRARNAIGFGDWSPSGTGRPIQSADARKNVVLSRTELRLREGGRGRYAVRLGARPAGAVTVAISVQADADAGISVHPGALTFLPDDHSLPRTVSVRAGHDPDSRAETAAIAHTVSSSDADYAALAIASVSLAVADDDEDTVPRFDAAVPAQTWTDGERVSLVLPEARGGNGAPVYSMEGLPRGLAFHAPTRTLSGAAVETAAPVAVRYHAEDADGDRTTLVFAIFVRAAPSASKPAWRWWLYERLR